MNEEHNKKEISEECNKKIEIRGSIKDHPGGSKGDSNEIDEKLEEINNLLNEE